MRWFRRKNKVSRGPKTVTLRARYDAAQHTTEYARYWQHADGLSAQAAMTPEVRRTLRNRARYEVANNSYAFGIVETLADYLIGTGPRLQLRLPDTVQCNRVELQFEQWAEAVRLTDKLKTMRRSYAMDGEAFAMLTTNPALETTVKLDFQLIEADRVETPIQLMGDERINDGIEYDAYGNPAFYYVLKDHPGDMGGVSQDYLRVPASAMVHWYKHLRPGQRRGICELTPALNLFAQLRRYALAVLAAAETAAEFAMVLFTKTPPGGEAAECEPMDKVELERRMATVLPEGWELSQVRPEQPTTAYRDFVKQTLCEICRCLCMPFGIAFGNFEGYNYASGRLDNQGFFKKIKNEQADLSIAVLNPVLKAWLWEAALIEGFLPQAVRTVRSVPHEWFFDGVEHVDPVKEANAQRIRLDSNTTTLAAEFARQGRDWETELHQRAKEKQLLTQLGLMDETLTPTVLVEEDDDEE
ncbi:MAG: phage portal protein [Phycisphaerae bacterium]|nr:phage portal protein [Phycisphaerae bacterium]